MSYANISYLSPQELQKLRYSLLVIDFKEILIIILFFL